MAKQACHGFPERLRKTYDLSVLGRDGGERQIQGRSAAIIYEG
ncbi:hypothetical protein EMIT0180MI3_360018 [Priestia megaterium]